MKIPPILAVAILLTFSACKQAPHDLSEKAATPGLSLHTSSNPELEFENLRLYPITADAAYIEKHAAAAEYKNLGEAIGNPRFRITEKKPFGRFEDHGAVNLEP